MNNKKLNKILSDLYINLYRNNYPSYSKVDKYIRLISIRIQKILTRDEIIRILTEIYNINIDYDVEYTENLAYILAFKIVVDEVKPCIGK